LHRQPDAGAGGSDLFATADRKGKTMDERLRIGIAEAIGTMILIVGGPGTAVLATGHFFPKASDEETEEVSEAGAPAPYGRRPQPE
jgi:hypothetical protein